MCVYFFHAQNVCLSKADTSNQNNFYTFSAVAVITKQKRVTITSTKDRWFHQWLPILLGITHIHSTTHSSSSTVFFRIWDEIYVYSITNKKTFVPCIATTFNQSQLFFMQLSIRLWLFGQFLNSSLHGLISSKKDHSHIALRNHHASKHAPNNLPIFNKPIWENA